MTLRTFSYGGGVQSTAALVLAAQGRIDYRVFLFANVGEDSEHPKTLAYVRTVAMPFAVKHGLDLVELRRYRPRAKDHQTLFERLTKEGSRSLPIPVRMSNTGAPGTRSCTADYKIRVIAKWQKEHGASAGEPAITGLGISLDELQRAKTTSMVKGQTLDYPLLTLRLDRQACKELIAAAGLPVPPKSSCWFCPLRHRSAWQWQREHEPELFQKSCDLEALLNRRRVELGRDPVYFHRKLLPLAAATSPHRQLSFFDEERDDEEGGCESGFCMV